MSGSDKQEGIPAKQATEEWDAYFDRALGWAKGRRTSLTEADLDELVRLSRRHGAIVGGRMFFAEFAQYGPAAAFTPEQADHCLARLDFIMSRLSETTEPFRWPDDVDAALPAPKPPKEAPWFAGPPRRPGRMGRGS